MRRYTRSIPIQVNYDLTDLNNKSSESVTNRLFTSIGAVCECVYSGGGS